MSPPRTTPGDPPARRKSVLFCANCGHDSHVNGDWIMHKRSGSRSIWYQCPECSRVVSVRPTHTLDESHLPSPLSAASSRGSYGTIREAAPETELWDDFWDTYRHATRAWLTPWRQSFASSAD